MRRVAFFAALLACPLVAHAQPKPRHLLTWSSLTGGRVGPLGLISINNFGYRRRLSKRDDLLFASSHVALLGLVNVSPTFGFVGARLQIEPLAVLRLSADYEYGGQFRFLGNVQSFESSQADVSPKALLEGAKEGNHHGSRSQRITLNLLAQARYRKIALRYNLQSRYNILSLPPGRSTWFNATLDILVPNRGWTLVHDVDLLWQVSKQLYAAGRYTQVAAMHPDKQGPAPIHRLGPALVWRKPTDKWSRVDASTLVVMLQWHLRHPYRAGQEISAGIPMLLLAWGLTGKIPLGKSAR